MDQPHGELVAITCTACGGAVALEAGQTLPRCLYCGSEAIEEVPFDETIEQPTTNLPFVVDPQGADEAFRAFARSSFWYPKAIRDATLDLEPLLLAAWTWSGTVETHYAGLVRARSPSGKRPVTGSDVARMEDVVVPSSSAISRAELAAVAPFSYAEEVPYDVRTAGLPFEPGTVSRAMARADARAQMAQLHAAVLRKREGATSLNPATVLSSVEGRPVLLPVYVGVFRHGDQPYRVVINGQNGKLTGKAPISMAKVVLVALGVFGALALCATLLFVGGVLSQG